MQTVAYLQLCLAQKYTITGNKYKFVQVVQETAADECVLTVAIDEITTCYSRWCSIYCSHLFCYVKCLTSLLTFEVVAMSLYHIISSFPHMHKIGLAMQG